MKWNVKQQDEFAKHLWDLSKITYAVLVVGLLAKREDFNTVSFTAGLITTIGLMIAALLMRRKKGKK